MFINKQLGGLRSLINYRYDQKQPGGLSQERFDRYKKDRFGYLMALMSGGVTNLSTTLNDSDIEGDILMFINGYDGFVGKTTQQLRDRFQLTDQSSVVNQLFISNQEDVKHFSDFLGLCFHDVGNKISLLKEAVPTNNQSEVLNIKRSIAQELRLFERFFKGDLPVEKVTIEEISAELSSGIQSKPSNGFILDIGSIPSNLAGSVYNWNRKLIKDLGENIAQNLERINPQDRSVSIVFGETQNGRLYIQIDDNDEGSGFSDDLIRDGFTFGKSTFEDGKGIGMAMHNKILRILNGGEAGIMPVKKIPEEGKTPDGGRQIIYLTPVADKVA